MQRLDKILSDAGVASRKELKNMIRTGRVTVNGAVIREPESKADAGTDMICVDGCPIRRQRTVILMLHKPAGVVTSTEDPRDATVMELLPPEYQNLDIAPVGRLDKETEGLLLLTNDGQLAHQLISPKHRVPKVYEAEHDGQAGEADIKAFSEGLVLKDGTKCLPAKLEPLGPGHSRITVFEGKYHQVRRMMASRGMPVNYLIRVSEGPLELGNLARGACRELSEQEEDAIRVRQSAQ